MLTTARILAILGGVLGLVINIGLVSTLGVIPPGGIVTWVDRIFSIVWPVVGIMAGALATERRQMGDMLATEIAGTLMLISAVGMAAFLGIKTIAAIPVILSTIGAFLALIASDYIRAEQRTNKP